MKNKKLTKKLLTARVYNVLDNLYYQKGDSIDNKRISDLIKITEHEYLMMRGLSIKSVDIIRDLVGKIGLELTRR